MGRNKDTSYNILIRKNIYLALTIHSIKIIELPYLLKHCY